MISEPLRILVALDGSAEAESVLSALWPIYRTYPVKLTFVRVVKPGESVAPARAYLETLESSLRAGAGGAYIRTPCGRPIEEILRLSTAGRFDFIAMTTHGRTGLRRAMMGSVAEEVLRHADIPLLVNRPDTKPGEWKRILVPLDGSLRAEEALPDAIRFAKAFGGSLDLLTVGKSEIKGTGKAKRVLPEEDPLSYLRRVWERVSREGVTAIPVTREGPAGWEISDHASEVGTGLICMTTHGWMGLARMLVGSIAEEVLRTAPCPVFVRRTVKPPVPAEAVLAEA